MAKPGVGVWYAAVPNCGVGYGNGVIVVGDTSAWLELGGGGTVGLNAAAGLFVAFILNFGDGIMAGRGGTGGIVGEFVGISISVCAKCLIRLSLSHSP